MLWPLSINIVGVHYVGTKDCSATYKARKDWKSETQEASSSLVDKDSVLVLGQVNKSVAKEVQPPIEKKLTPSNDRKKSSSKASTSFTEDLQALDQKRDFLHLKA